MSIHPNVPKPSNVSAMENTEIARENVVSQDVSQTDGSGTPTVDLERTIGLFAGRLRRKHAEEIRTDARKFKSRVITILRRKLPPFAGRPTEAAITSAIELRKHDQPWKEIYPHCIRNHSELDPAKRRQADSNLASGLSATLPLL